MLQVRQSIDLLEALQGDVLGRVTGADQKQLLSLELVSVSEEGAVLIVYLRVSNKHSLVCV